MQKPPTAPPPQLTAAQRAALRLAEAAGWGVAVEAADGTQLQLRRGHPGRALVLYLGDRARLADERRPT